MRERPQGALAQTVVAWFSGDVGAENLPRIKPTRERPAGAAELLGYT